MATLTGAVIIALGDHNTGIMGNDQAQLKTSSPAEKRSAKTSGSPVVRGIQQTDQEHIADVKNIGLIISPYHYGAAFIQEFIDKAKWTHGHCGYGGNDSAKPHQAKGPTAVALRTLIKYVERSQ